MKRMRRKCKTLLLAVLLLITGVIIGEVNVSAAEKEITIDSISVKQDSLRMQIIRMRSRKSLSMTRTGKRIVSHLLWVENIVSGTAPLNLHRKATVRPQR